MQRLARELNLGVEWDGCGVGEGGGAGRGATGELGEECGVSFDDDEIEMQKHLVCSLSLLILYIYKHLTISKINAHFYLGLMKNL